MSGIDCDEVLREVEAYLDQELDAERRVFVERHLATCSPCAKRADFQQRLRDIVARKCGQAHAMPDSLFIRVRMVIDEERGTTSA